MPDVFSVLGADHDRILALSDQLSTSLPVLRHTIPINPSPSPRQYDVDASFMQLGLHGCGIHA
jgi:hypothetical protein